MTDPCCLQPDTTNVQMFDYLGWNSGSIPGVFKSFFVSIWSPIFGVKGLRGFLGIFFAPSWWRWRRCLFSLSSGAGTGWRKGGRSVWREHSWSYEMVMIQKLLSLLSQSREEFEIEFQMLTCRCELFRGFNRKYPPLNPSPKRALPQFNLVYSPYYRALAEQKLLGSM